MAGTIEEAPRGAARAAIRILTVAALYAAGVRALWWAGAGIQSDLRRPGPLPPDVAVEAAGALAAWACLLWWGLAFLATALGALPGAWGRAAAHCSARFAPAAIRRLTGYVLGAALVSGTTAALATPAGAVSAPTPGPVPVPVPIPGNLSGTELPSLDRPGLDPPRLDPPRLDPPATEALAATPSPDAASRPAPCPAPVPHPAHRHGVRSKIDPPRASATVVVRPGDTLWGIAARHLGPRASTASVAAAWPRWYRANAAAVGADPHLIRPGLRLRPVPDAEETR